MTKTRESIFDKYRIYSSVVNLKTSFMKFLVKIPKEIKKVIQISFFLKLIQHLQFQKV